MNYKISLALFGKEGNFSLFKGTCGALLLKSDF